MYIRVCLLLFLRSMGFVYKIALFEPPGASLQFYTNPATDFKTKATKRECM